LDPYDDLERQQSSPHAPQQTSMKFMPAAGTCGTHKGATLIIIIHYSSLFTTFYLLLLLFIHHFLFTINIY